LQRLLAAVAGPSMPFDCIYNALIGFCCRRGRGGWSAWLLR
jgi:hypothetical protein